MMQGEQVEEMLCLIASLDREAIIEQFALYQASFPIDFTREFLDSISIERLRHIFAALCLEQQHGPMMHNSIAA